MKTRLFKYIENFTAKKGKFSDKISAIIHISSENIDCGTCYNRLGKAVLTSTHNLCFWAEIKKNNVYPCKPQIYCIKLGFNGVKNI